MISIMRKIGWAAILFTLISLSLFAQNREQLYQLGKKSFQDQLYSDSIQHLKDFMNYYPNDPRNDSALYMVGVSWYYLRNYPSALAALEALENQFDISPYRNRTAYWMGLSYYSSRNYLSAIPQFERQLSASQEEYYYDRSLLYLGLSEEKLGRWSQASQWYTQLQQESGNTTLLAQAFFRGGLSLMQQNLYEEALSQFQRLTMDFTSNPVGRELPFYIGVCYTQMDDLEEANRRFRTYLQLNRQGDLRESSLLYLAKNSYSLGQLNEAQDFLAELIEEFPQGEQTLSSLKMLVSISMDQQDWENAETALQQLISLSDSIEDRVQASYSLAEIYLKQDRLAEAAPLLEFVNRQGSGEFKRKSLLMSAHLQRDLGHTDSAMALYQQYWDQYSDYSDAVEAGRWLISLYREQGKNEEMHAIVDTMIRKFPEDRDRPAFLYMKGEFTQAMGDDTEALTWYNTLVEEFPGETYSAHALYRIGYIYAQRGEHQRASQYFRKLLKAEPDDQLKKDGLYSLALSLYKGDSSQEALPVMEQYLQDYPDDSRTGEVGYSIGDIYYQNGNYTKAEEAFRFSAGAYDSEEASRSIYMQGLSVMQMDQWERARSIFQELYSLYPSNSWSIEGLYMSGVAARTLEDYLNAEKDLTLAADQSSGEKKERAWFMLAQVYLDQDKKEDCLTLLDQMKEEFPQGNLASNLVYRQGDLAFSAEKYTEALDWYTLCVSHYPQSELAEQAQIRLIRCHLELLDYQTAQEELLHYLTLFDSPLYENQAYRSFAESVEMNGNAEEGEAFYSQIKEAGASDTLLAPVYLAVIELGGFQDAPVSNLEKIQENETLDGIIRNHALLLLAQNSEEQGEYAEAAELYRVLIATDSGEIGAEAQFALARSLSFTDKKAGADEYMNLTYLYPDQTDLIPEALFRAWQLYTQLDEQQQKADIVADKLKEDYPLSEWAERLKLFDTEE